MKEQKKDVTFGSLCNQPTMRSTFIWTTQTMTWNTLHKSWNKNIVNINIFLKLTICIYLQHCFVRITPRCSAYIQCSTMHAVFFGGWGLFRYDLDRSTMDTKLTWASNHDLQIINNTFHETHHGLNHSAIIGLQNRNKLSHFLLGVRWVWLRQTYNAYCMFGLRS